MSVFGLNNLFYADALLYDKKKDEACTILKAFEKQDPETLMPDRIPETKKEIQTAQESN